jgi:hypothetical protein
MYYKTRLLVCSDVLHFHVLYDHDGPSSVWISTNHPNKSGLAEQSELGPIAMTCRVVTHYQLREFSAFVRHSCWYE